MAFYIKKTFVDSEPSIELVNIHYTCTPLSEMPNWEAHRETRAMPCGGVLMRGMGGTTHSLPNSASLATSALPGVMTSSC